MNIEQELKNKLINAIIPDSAFKILGGEVDVERIQELIEKYEAAQELDETEVNIPSISGILGKLIPKIPEKVTPSVADLQEYVDTKISDMKYNAQRNITEKHISEASKAEKAFSQRKITRSIIRTPLTR